MDDTDCLAVLVIRARTGDRVAFAELVRRCAPMVEAVAARHTVRPADVEDVVQEVWLTLARWLPRLDDPLALRGWLATVTRRTAWRGNRRNRRLVPSDELAEQRADDDTEAEATRRADAADLERTVHGALGDLRPCDRRLLVLLMADDRPDYRSISRAVDRPIGSIGPTRQRAISHLRRDRTLQSLRRAI